MFTFVQSFVFWDSARYCARHGLPFSVISMLIQLWSTTSTGNYKK